MSNDQQTKARIQQAIQSFGRGATATCARDLFAALGYHSENTLDLTPNTAAEFRTLFDPDGRLNAENALLDHWRSVDLLFQLTDEHIAHSEQTRMALDGDGAVDERRMESYLVFAIALRDAAYTRTQLAGITREVNKLFAMPALLLFRHGDTLSLAVIDRRLNKRDESKDVLQKVTLIKDIRIADPHRAHIEILLDLSLPKLTADYGFHDFAGLHDAWRATLDTSELNKRFFREIANWYYWAMNRVVFPAGAGRTKDERNALSLIRLLTRLIFVWFLKEKGLVPEELFDGQRLKAVLKDAEPQQSAYYKAILQNLFFATLSQEMNTPGAPDNRRWKAADRGGRNPQYMVHDVYRYKSYFKNPDAALALFATIPFLNGGLFECLDQSEEVRVDGFSERDDNPLKVPDDLFFGDKRAVDLNEVFGTHNKKYEARGLIQILGSYKFTVAENTPIEEEVALDPELLGKVFENLLAAYNPETGVTARKQTGSFYTPREIVNYMVDESLVAYFETKFPAADEAARAALGGRLRHLLAYNAEPHQFSGPETATLIAAIDRLKALDPACGSGAFPLGILHKLVFILGKLDPGNARWEQAQLAKAGEIQDAAARAAAVASIEEAFKRNELDYGRKLYLIENCIYGVDIQPIAVQIAKLRCFISLIVDEKPDEARANRGILPLPNLETRFVAANTLIGLARPQQLLLRNPAIEAKEAELARVRQAIFSARTRHTKEKYRAQDRALRAELKQLFAQDGFPTDTVEQLAGWDPYAHNTAAGFFDPEWMFGIRDGFDVVIGNPPYVRQEQLGDLKPALQRQYRCYTGTADLYVYFYERGLQVLNGGGVLTYISSNKFFRAAYGAKLRAYLAGQTRIRQAIDFGDAPVFDAIAYPSIIIAQRAEPGDNQTRALTWTPGADVKRFPEVFQASSFLVMQRELTANGWRLEVPSVLRLLEKLRGNGTQPLGEYVGGRLYRGILTGLNDAFVVDRETRDRLIDEHASSREVLKPFLRGRDVKRWNVQYADLYLIKIESSENVPHAWSNKTEREAERVFAAAYPAIREHFQQYRDGLIARDDQGRYFWELRSCVYWKEFEKPKIVIPAIAQAAEFAADLKKHLSNDKTTICVCDDVDYTLGVLNSRLVWWYIRQVAASRQGGFYEFKPMYVSQIPIVKQGNHHSVEQRVAKVRSALHDDPDADVSDAERAIDEAVYRLYGLTAEEIKVVEGA